MDFELWLINIISAVLELSDREFQKRVWLEGKDSESYCSSFVEAYCGLYDDFNFKLFLEDDRVIHDARLHTMLLSFDRKLEAFEGDQFDDERFNSEQWQAINREAAALLHPLIKALWELRSAEKR